MSLYSAFLPRDRRSALQRRDILPDRLQGAALLADLSGFTRLTATLAEELGPRRGAEALIGHLDRVFTLLISAVHAFDGDVILFNGDAITCWFPENDQPSATSAEPAAVRATRCALAMQAAMSELASVTTPAGTVIPLAIKVGIAAGPARRFLLGDPDAYVIESLAGRTLDRMAQAEELAKRGEVIVSSEVASQLPPEQVRLGEWQAFGDEQYVAVLAWSGPEVSNPANELLPITDELAQCWLLPPVAQRIGEGSEAFLADLRPTVTMFLGFSGIDYDGDDAAGHKLNQFVVAAQAILDRYEGYLLQVTMGDKGSLMNLSFGAPIAHENDSERAAAAALSLNRLIDEFDFLDGLRIGISRGVVYSGAYGSPQRRTYSLLGSEVNVASRLMTAAAPGSILVSDFVADDIDSSFTLEPLAPVAVKGIDNPIPVWCLTGRRSSVGGESLARSGQVAMMGRSIEQELIAAKLSELCGGASNILFIEGNAGVGKSLLIADLLIQTDEQDESEIVILAGAGDAIEQTTPYLAWQPILQQIVSRATALSADADIEARTHALLNWLDPELRPLAPLLNPLLGLRLPETQLTEQMSGEGRLLNTQELILSMLRTVTEGLPLLLVIDDAHWLDSLSIGLVRRASRELDPALIVIAMRPFADATSPILEDLRSSPDTVRLLLGTLPKAETEQVIARQLGSESVRRDVLDFIYSKAEGHPYFTVELANALRDAGLLTSEAGVAQFVSGSDMAVVDFPDTIQGVITSRIDRLEPQEQLTVKVASVIGRLFAYRVLRDVYPTHQDAGQIRNNLDQLERLDLTTLESTDPDLTYLFKHIVTQEVVYGMMTTTQRRQLHENIALRYEGTMGSGDSRTIPLLAYHWSRAGDRVKAATYFGRAGENALREYANEEAIQFLNEASRLGQDMPAAQRAHWQRLLGEASYRLTRTEESKAHYEKALSLLGHPIPESSLGLTIGILGALVRQAINRRISARPVIEDDDELSLLKESALSLDRISEVYYNTGDELRSFYSVISALNLAEKGGPSQETVRGYANLSTTLGFLALTSLADSYRERALALAKDLDHLPTTAWIQIAFSSYSLWYGKWDRCSEEIDVAMDLNAQLGDWRLWGVAAWLLPQVTTSLGDLALARQQWAELYATALKNENTRHQIWSRGGLFFNFLDSGQLDEAGNCLRDVEKTVELHSEHLTIDERLWYSMQARYALEQGLFTSAREWTDGLIEAIHRSKFKYDLIDVFSTPAEVRLRLWPEGMATASEIKDACQILRSYAKKYPFASARSLRYEGVQNWLLGKQGTAQKLWQKSIVRADTMGMPLEKALTLESIGRLTGDDQAATQAMVIRAELQALGKDFVSA